MNKFVESSDVPHRVATLEHNICVCVDFILDKVAPGQVLLRVMQFSLINIIPPFYHTHLFICHRRNQQLS